MANDEPIQKDINANVNTNPSIIVCFICLLLYYNINPAQSQPIGQFFYITFFYECVLQYQLPFSETYTACISYQALMFRFCECTFVAFWPPQNFFESNNI